MAVKERAVEEPTHIDNEWISERIAGHGGAYYYNSLDGLARISFIGSKPKRVIWVYNLQLLRRYIKRKMRRKKMSGECCKDNRPVREMTLPEEIRELEKYDVPDHVIERICRKVAECGEMEMSRIKSRDTLIQELQESNRNKDAVIDALGGYLAIKNSGYKREL